MLELEEALC